MNRPWKIWLGFGICFAVLLAVVGWVSVTALRSDRARQTAEAEADVEEKVRLALWRMDSMLAPLIAQESARPSSDYLPSQTAGSANGNSSSAHRVGGQSLPPPLSTLPSSNILLHFQMDRQFLLSSPQVPPTSELAAVQSHPKGGPQIDIARTRLERLNLILKASGTNPSSPESRQAKDANGQILFNQLAASVIDPDPSTTKSTQVLSKAPRQQAAQVEQMARNDLELGARAQSFQNAIELNIENVFKNRALGEHAVEGPLRPVWLGSHLFLARRVVSGGREVVQGCWLDWPGLQHWLLGNVRDLLPNASLEPLADPAPEIHGRALASLPVRLVSGVVISSYGRPSGAIMTAVILGWGCVLLAGAAMAALLRGTLALSERRAAFVSAVTHELRTPLTTFKMYAEMLADGMVPDERKQREYLLQMCSEADRLHHLVENVLAYARLERGSVRRRTERVTLGDLVQRVKPRLEQRAEQGSMVIRERAEATVLATVVEVDVSAVEQILFNLVDNACKYAAPLSEDKTIYIEAVSGAEKFAMLRVCDSGQGISAEAAERLFQPFSKSAQDAAGSVPGVGLGLALCRGLGRSMGGELRLARGNGKGACFELCLPVVP